MIGAMGYAPRFVKYSTALVAAAILALPGSARAATASVQNRVITYAAAGDNDSTLEVSGPNCYSVIPGPCPPDKFLVRLLDFGAPFGRGSAGEPITPGTGCFTSGEVVPGQPPTPWPPDREVYCLGDIDSFNVGLGPGDDWVFIGTNEPAIIRGEAGDDRFEDQAQNDVVDGGSGNDTFTAELGDDNLIGGDGADTYFALPCPPPPQGCNAAAGSALDNGQDSFSGGPGVDTADFSAVLAAERLSADGVRDDGKPGEGDDIRPDVENIRGGAFTDRLVGNASDNQLEGGDGGDTIVGGGGRDLLDGGVGSDSLDGGAGADRLFGRAGTDSVSYAARTGDVDVTLDGAANDGEASEGDQVATDVEDVTTGSGDDDVTGSSVANRLAGGAGEDFLDGRGGGDSLVGGNAADMLRVRDRAADPSAGCGPGTDFVIADPADKAAADCEDVDNVLSDNPALGRRIVVEPSGGAVTAASAATTALRLRLPAVRRFVPLFDHLNLPVRSLIDTKSGKARVASRAVRTSRRRRLNAGVFSGGLFQVLQSRSRRRRGLTELRLKGSSFRRCRVGSARARSAARRYSRRTVRRVRGNGRGRFRTRGRYSAATVRGTTWTVADRCDGTLTRVRRGRVVVRDFRRKRSIRLRAGKSYLARVPG